MSKSLIYIIGAGRSGTTLIDIILGNNISSISLGEVNRFYKRDGVPPLRDQQSEVFRFWEMIKLGVDKKLCFNSRRLNKAFRKNEYHTAIFKSIFKFNDRLYKEALNAQYDEIYKYADADLLIESSKYPARALNLSNYIARSDVSIKYIYIKKDPVNVVKSFQKKKIEQPSKGFLSANLYYLIVNLLCILTVRLLKAKNHKVSVVKYEDLLEHREKEINRIGIDLDIDLTELEEKIRNDRPLQTGLLFDGNRIRLKETISLQTSNNRVTKNSNYYFTRIFNYIVYK